MSDIHYEVSWVEYVEDFQSRSKNIISDIIDERTKRSKSFETEEAAKDYAKNKLAIIKAENEEKWLAYMVINMITTAQILKIK